MRPRPSQRCQGAPVKPPQTGPCLFKVWQLIPQEAAMMVIEASEEEASQQQPRRSIAATVPARHWQYDLPVPPNGRGGRWTGAGHLCHAAHHRLCADPRSGRLGQRARQRTPRCRTSGAWQLRLCRTTKPTGKTPYPSSSPRPLIEMYPPANGFLGECFAQNERKYPWHF